jgi:pimeloyl-ACP methyl ester carboxylesterase
MYSGTKFRSKSPRTGLRGRKATLATVAALAVVLGTATAVSASTPASSASAPRATELTTIPVNFTVQNVNRSKVACASDGKTYTVRGHITGPAGTLRSKTIDGTTLYLHGLSFGEFFWRFDQATGYDYAANQAKAGQVSVTIDRLGYGASDKPDGNQICVGSRADIAHQIVLQLKAGSYKTVPTATVPKFAKVVLAGHSYGGQIAQVEAYSFGDIDGLAVIAYSDRVQSALLKSNAAYAASVCATGGLRVGGVGPAGYAPFGPPSGAPKALFASADPQVKAAALQLLTIDPCGDTASFSTAVAVDLANVASIRVPVLVIAGDKDALFPPPAVADQASLFTGSRAVAKVTLPGVAHAITLERTFDPAALRTVDRWLEKLFRRS